MTARVFAALLAMHVMAGWAKPQSVPEGTPWIVFLATSTSDYTFAEQSQADIAGLVESLADGTQLHLYSVNSKISPVFAGRIDSAARGALPQKIRALQYKRYTDLPAGFSQALGSISATSSVPPAVLILTDGDPVPPRGSIGEGKSLQTILNDVLLLPDGVQIFLRIHGKDPGLKITRANITVLPEPVDWRKLVRPEVVSLPAAPAPPEVSSSASWRAVAALTVIGFLAVGVFVLLGVRHIDGSAAGADKLMMKPALSAPSSEKEALSRPVRIHRFVLRIGDSDETILLDKTHPRVVLGDNWESKALADCDTALCLEWSETVPRLRVTNLGPGDLRIGELPVKAGASRWIPRERVEITIGDRSIVAMPETINEEPLEVNSSGKGEAL